MIIEQNKILEYLKAKKPLVDDKVKEIIEKRRPYLSNINAFADDGLNRLSEFCNKGKSLRGILTILGAEMYGLEQNDALIELGAIIEIIHSSILIQDDIQDEDNMRRGFPSVFYQYQLIASYQNFKNPKFYGQSIAMDVYLIGHYLAMNALADLNISSDLKIKILSFLSSEIMKVGVAQSQDIYHAYVQADKISIADIENVHLYKTGRYTLSMPLMLGGIFSGKLIEDMKQIEEASEILGLVFQIKDDELSIFAEEEELGKKVGNDIIENKKTHFRELLYQRVSDSEKRILKTSFGNKNLNFKKVQKIRELLIKYNVQEDIQGKMDMIGAKAMSIIDEVSIDQSRKELLYSLINYLLHRTK